MRELRTEFPIRRTVGELARGAARRAVLAVRDVTIHVDRGTTLGLVGESGSGKTTLARSILGLEVPVHGAVSASGRALTPRLRRRSRDDLRAIQAVPQNPDQALNPYMTIGASLRRPLRRLVGMSSREAGRTVVELLERVGLPPGFADRVPSALSGGEKQRVAIARAFASHPALIVCDEATSSLDVSVQARVLNLLTDLQRSSGGAYLFITHDLSVVAHLADRIAVMYLGVLFEIGPTPQILAPPYHPYTEALLSAVPVVGFARRKPSVQLTGELPSSVDRPTGCPLHTRCPRLLGDICRELAPPWQEVGPHHRLYCHIEEEALRRAQRPIFSLDPGGTPWGG